MLSVPTVITRGDYGLHPVGNEEISVILLFAGGPLPLWLEVHN